MKKILLVYLLVFLSLISSISALNILTPINNANVSKYLNGERPLSKKQIIGLKKDSGLVLIFL